MTDSIRSGSVGDGMTIGSEATESRLKRTFTLPRNPFNNSNNASRMSKRKVKSKEEDNKSGGANDERTNNKKVFRR